MRKITATLGIGALFLSCLFLFSSPVFGDTLRVNIEQFNHYPKDNYMMGYLAGTYFYRSGTTLDHAYAWYAPVNLPAYRVIRGLRIKFYDYDLDMGDNVFCELRRVNMYTGVSVAVYKVNSSGNEDEYNVQHAINRVPEDPSAAYSHLACSWYLYVYFGDTGSQLRFYGATIYFDDF